MTESETPTLLSHMPSKDELSEDSLLTGFLNYAKEKGLSLYPAQEEAVLEIFAGHSVVLNTPTGSGKSLVALAQHFKAIAEGKRCFYTAPIKALVSEKFFDLCETLGASNVGMMTGDASVNSDAPIICCTAEILSNVALRKGDQAAVDYVVMDEFHFYSDRDRGVAWQVPLLTLPQSRFLLMSATLGETDFFVKEVEALTGVTCTLVKSRDRPVPLDYEYRVAPIHETITELLDVGHVPIYVVHFTQRSAAERAQSLMSINFLSKAEKAAIKERISKTRFDSPFGKELKRFLPHGVGVHHAGMLPKYRRLVEQLAQAGLLKIICGTDTLGVGVNVPIRSVLFTKLCKYDGTKTKVLSVRDFQQIAGRAGRKGFDTRGSVIAHAPDHVVENQSMRAKASGDAKKLRKLKMKKPPEKGYAHFDEATFQRLIESEPEPLVSRFDVSYGMLLNVLARENGCAEMKRIIRASHGTKKTQRQHGRKAIGVVRSLMDADIVTITNKEVSINADLQQDFSLNQASSLYAVEAIAALDIESESYGLDTLSIVESILENPRVVLLRQLDKLKTNAINQMKAEGVEYDERMARLEEIEAPKPLADFIYSTFETFRKHHPWVGSSIEPKSIARDMYEQGLGFSAYVKEYGLGRAEGVLLRYLSQTYKTIDQNVPENLKTDAVYDLADWLHAVVRDVDSSLLDEWQRMADPTKEIEKKEVVEVPQDVTTNQRAFMAMIRNESFKLVRLLALRRYSEAAEVTGVSASEIESMMVPYWDSHTTLRMDAEARSPKHCSVDKAGDEWNIVQRLVDPEDHLDMCILFSCSLPECREQDRAVLKFKSVSPVSL